MIDSGFARVVAVGVGIGAGLLVPRLRHHDDPERTPAVYVDPPYVEPTPTQVEPPAVADREEPEENIRQLHVRIALPAAFAPYGRHAFQVSFESDADTIVRMEERQPDAVRNLRTAVQVADVAADMGFDVDAEQVKARLPDGRYPFTTYLDTHEPGWLASKMCGDRQILIAVQSSSKKEMQQTIAAFHSARCTEDLQEY